MKTNGCIADYREEKERQLMKAYRKALSECRCVNLNTIFKKTADSPASRFFVSEERAAAVISKMMRGQKPKMVSALKMQMFREILRRVQDIRSENPTFSIYHCCVLAVNSPAPKFYMTPLSVRQTIYRLKREYSKRK